MSQPIRRVDRNGTKVKVTKSGAEVKNAHYTCCLRLELQAQYLIRHTHPLIIRSSLSFLRTWRTKLFCPENKQLSFEHNPHCAAAKDLLQLCSHLSRFDFLSIEVCCSINMYFLVNFAFPPGLCQALNMFLPCTLKSNKS